MCHNLISTFLSCFKQLNPLDCGLSEDKFPVSEMTYSYPNEDDADQLWAKPEADSKYYVDYDFSYVSTNNTNEPVNFKSIPLFFRISKIIRSQNIIYY